MGLFSWFSDVFGTSSDSSFDSGPTGMDYGVNPSTGLPMINSAIDAGGNCYGCSPSSFSSDDSWSSSSAFDSSSSFDSFSSMSSTSSFDD